MNVIDIILSSLLLAQFLYVFWATWLRIKAGYNSVSRHLLVVTGSLILFISIDLLYRFLVISNLMGRNQVTDIAQVLDFIVTTAVVVANFIFFINLRYEMHRPRKSESRDMESIYKKVKDL